MFDALVQDLTCTRVFEAASVPVAWHEPTQSVVNTLRDVQYSRGHWLHAVYLFADPSCSALAVSSHLLDFAPSFLTLPAPSHVVVLPLVAAAALACVLLLAGQHVFVRSRACVRASVVLLSPPVRY